MHHSEVYNSTTLNDNLTQHIRRMPKIELHVHLEGSTNAEAVYAMAKRNGVALPASSLEAWKTYYNFRDFDHFIDVYLLVAQCIKTPKDYALMVESYMQLQFEHNIQYSEVYFSPSLHRDKLPAAEILEALSKGIQRGSEKYGTQVKFIPDISREIAANDKVLQRYVLEFALTAKVMGIGIGMGIGGKEIGYPPEIFRDIFAEARQQGLHVVAHGGETGGAESIHGALQTLKAERIGHGVRAIEDSTLMATLKEKQVPLEISPQSNYCIGIVERDQPHPIRKLVDAGLYCTVNSDDPPFFSTDLSNEYLTLAAQGFSFDELWQLNLNALNASFLSDDEKATYFSKWEQFVYTE